MTATPPTHIVHTDQDGDHVQLTLADGLTIVYRQDVDENGQVDHYPVTDGVRTDRTG